MASSAADQAVSEAHRYAIVVHGNLAKFDQHPKMRAYLLSTGTRILVEASPTDRIWGIGLAADDPHAAADQCRVLCERHEDWVLLRGGDAELVSAKHWGLSLGAYTTLNSLADDRGVGHLYGRWLAMQEKATCRLVTTAGLGDGQPKQLGALAEKLRDRRLAGQELVTQGEFEELLTAFGKALLKHCDGLARRWGADSSGRGGMIPSADHRQQVARFLSMFSYQASPARDYVSFAAPNMPAEPRHR